MLQAAISLGLDPVFNPIKTLPIKGNTTYTQDHVPEPRIFYYSQRENETRDEYFDRIIEESFGVVFGLSDCHLIG